MVSSDKSSYWNRLVELASECYGQPKLFWDKLNRLRGSNFSKITHLTEEIVESDSEDSDYGETVEREYVETIDKVEYMSRVWKEIFKPNSDPIFNNHATRTVTNWFNANLQQFAHRPK